MLGFLFIIIILPIISYIIEYDEKSKGYDDIVKVTEVSDVTEDNKYRFIQLSNGKHIKVNKKWQSYKYNINDSIYVRYEGDSVIYAGNRYRASN